jgi:hypothetical protein
MKKLGVVLPWDSPFIWRHSIENMLNWKRPDGVEVEFFFGGGWCPAKRHNSGVEKAMEWGANAIMIAGPDHIVERDVMVKLWGHIFEEGWDMATGIISSRSALSADSGPFRYTAIKRKEGVQMPTPVVAQMIFSSKLYDVISKEDPSQEIHCIGSGCLMVNRCVFEEMTRPWFVDHGQPDSLNFERSATNDTGFVMRATGHYGFRLWLDTSIDFRHLDIFPIDETYQDRFKDKDGIERWSPMGAAMNSPKF